PGGGAESAIGGSGSVGGRGGGGSAVLSSAVTSRLVDASGQEPGPERAQDLTERAHIARGPALAEQRRQETRDRVDQHQRKARGRVLAVASEQWRETGCPRRTVRRLAVRGIAAVGAVGAVDDRAQIGRLTFTGAGPGVSAGGRQRVVPRGGGQGGLRIPGLGIAGR